MNAEPQPTMIDLAREAPFRLGAGEVRPATREIVWSDQRETLEPRVMQVLVALARAGGEVISRDSLIRDCWNGRIVGDDAINRCIVQLRRTAERVGGFGVETIPRVGYRLTDVSRRRLPVRRWMIGAAGLALAVLAGVLLWWLRPWGALTSAEPRIAVRPFVALGSGAQLKVTADRLSDDIAGALSQTNLTATVPSHVAAKDILVGATLSQEGADLRVRAYLLDSAGAHTLWTRQFAGPATDVAALRDEISGSLIEATLIAVEPFRQRRLRLDPETWALYIKGRWAMSQPDALRGGEPAAALAAAEGRDPDFVAARAMLVLTDMIAASQDSDPKIREEKLLRARNAALKVIRADSRAAEGAYLALYRFDRARSPTDLVRLENDILEGLAKVPQSPLLKDEQCELLAEVGRITEAGNSCQQALALRPMATRLVPPYGYALYVSGNTDLAKEQLDKGLRYHPDGVDIRTRRLWIDLFSGPPEEARKRLHDDRLRPQDWETEHVQLAELFLKARETHAAADAQQFLDQIERLNSAGLVPSNYLVISAGALGRTDVAFEALKSSPDRFVRDGFLFEPATASLRRDPRFWALAHRWGLVAYWRKRNVWPDFCGDPALGYDCRAAASASISSNVSPFVSLAARAAMRLTVQQAAK